MILHHLFLRLLAVIFPFKQTMTEAEHNRPIPKLFSDRPSASAAEVFGLLREPIIKSEFHT